MQIPWNQVQTLLEKQVLQGQSTTTRKGSKAPKTLPKMAKIMALTRRISRRILVHAMFVAKLDTRPKIADSGGVKEETMEEIIEGTMEETMETMVAILVEEILVKPTWLNHQINLLL